MESFLGLDFSRNYSYLTVPAAYLNILVPHAYAVFLAGKSYDNANPRGLSENIAKNEKISKIIKRRIGRAQAAQANGYETLGLFAAGVIAANQAQLETRWLNTLTFGYVLSRVAYNFAYIFLGENRALSNVRSLVWGIGIGFTLMLWVNAGKALKI